MSKPIIFEASFHNLDLSEFDTSANNTNINANTKPSSLSSSLAAAAVSTAKLPPPISASQQLLQTKQNEWNQKQYEIQQEEYIQSKAMQRQEEYLKRATCNGDSTNSKSNNNNGDDGGMFVNALLSMHNNDAFGKQLEKSNSKRCKGQKKSSLGSSRSINSKNNKTGSGLGSDSGITRIKKGGIVKKSRQSKHYKR